MFKFAGAAAIFISCLSIGFTKSYRMKKRCNSLNSLILATERIGAEVSFTKKRLERIFNDIARDFKLPVFSDTAVLMLNLGTRHAWSRSLSKYADDMALTASDIKAAKTLNSIGDFSGEQQQQLIHTTLRLLELSFAEATENYSKTGKLYRSCGVLFGMLGVILLF